MPTSATKAMIIGLDAPIVPRLYDYAMKGHLPTIKGLIERGVNLIQKAERRGLGLEHRK